MVGAAMRSTHPLLSSKTVEWAVMSLTSRQKESASLASSAFRGIRSRRDWESDIYSDSVVERAISDWSLDAHRRGQLV